MSMQGHLPQMGLQAGFMPSLPVQGELTEGLPLYSRGAIPDIDSKTNSVLQRMDELRRGAYQGDVTQLILDMQQTWTEFQRAITSTMTAFPVRENLEAEAKLLVPLDTPMRNRLARRPGSGLASKWKQILSLGGGYAAATLANGAITLNASAQSVAVDDSTIFAVGDVVIVGSGSTTEAVTITTKADGTHITGIFLASHDDNSPIIKAKVQPGSPQGYIRTFFAETGAPAAHTTVYADKTATYKLLGTYGSVTGLAMAGGANFQNQLATEKRNALRNLMLNEENAIINGDSSATAAPWGDGGTALAYDGINNLITVANGSLPTMVQAAVGALTTAHIDNQLTRVWEQGGQGLWMLMNQLEAQSLVHLAEASGTILRYAVGPDGRAVLGVHVGGYVHPVSGEMVDIIVDRFQPYGTIVFGCDRLPDGSPSADMDVLPQVQLPQLAPNENVQGYTAQELAPTTSAPQVYPFICTCYEVLRLKSAQHFAKSSGITAV